MIANVADLPDSEAGRWTRYEGRRRNWFVLATRLGGTALRQHESTQAAEESTEPEKDSAKRNFSTLWIGRGIHAIGVQVRIMAFPLLAVSALGAGTSEIGILHASTTVAFLLVGLPAGPLVDRLPKKRVLITTSLGNALVLGLVMLSWHLGVLSLPLLYLAALLLGMGGVVAGVAFLSLIPEAVPSHQLVSLTSRVTVVQTLAQVSGPAAAGLLIAASGPVETLGFTLACFVVSAGCVAAIGVPPPAKSGEMLRTSSRHLIVEGLQYVRGHPLIRRITIAAASDAGFGAIWQAALVVFLVNTLRVSDAEVGLIFGIAAMGGVLGAAAAPRIMDRWGKAAALRWWLPASNLFGVFMLAASPGWSAYMVAGANFFMLAGAIVFNVAQTSTRLVICPKPMLGRMNATIRTIVWSSSAVGSLAGAGLGMLLAPRWVLCVGIVTTAIATWIACGARAFTIATPQLHESGNAYST